MYAPEAPKRLWLTERMRPDAPVEHTRISHWRWKRSLVAGSRAAMVATVSEPSLSVTPNVSAAFWLVMEPTAVTRISVPALSVPTGRDTLPNDVATLLFWTSLPWTAKI